MLVLTRKHQEKIRIGDSITITVLRTKGKAVRLGIEAPANVPVIRGELMFDVSPEELTRAMRDEESQETPPVAGRRSSGQGLRRTADRWTTDPPHRGELAEVSLRRVPRDQVAQVLPQLVAGSGPLRGMLEARTSTT